MARLFIFLFASVKFSKILLTVGTMALAIAAYSLFYGWRFAIGFILLILVHEMGHYVAARQRNLNVGLPTFIPFVGAWISLKEQPMNVETEAYVAMAGPLTGSLAALACYGLARQNGSHLLLALSYSGFFLNLFNLIPLPPFDGGRITAILSPRMWLIGAPILVAMFFWRPSPLLVVMALLAAPEVIKALKRSPETPETTSYYTASLDTKMTYSALYLGLAAFLAVMSYDVKAMLDS